MTQKPFAKPVWHGSSKKQTSFLELGAVGVSMNESRRRAYFLGSSTTFIFTVEAVGSASSSFCKTKRGVGIR